MPPLSFSFSSGSSRSSWWVDFRRFKILISIYIVNSTYAEIKLKIEPPDFKIAWLDLQIPWLNYKISWLNLGIPEGAAVKVH
jgi:hypothetical protein